MIAPHAYIVDYRVADACSPPACQIDGRRVFGRATEVPPGGYVTVGNDKDELFAKRGVVVPPSKDLSFTLPHVEAGALFDASLSAAEESGGRFRAVLEVRSGDAVIERRLLEGESAPFERRTEPDLLAREERYFVHVREPLPTSAREVTVVVRNEGSTRLGLGAPLVLRRVEGRKPRQAILVFFDAVPYPVFEQLYRGAAPSARWMSEWVKRGTLFSEAVSPGQLTGSFVRRFFRGDYYMLEGDPSLAGQGFDEKPPERAPGPVARLAEQGFLTEALGSNLYLSPLLSRVGFDSDYNVESTIELQVHPAALASRFAREIQIHGEDDALFVVWFANTHAPWRDGRPGSPPLRLEAGEELDLDVLEPIWKNLLDSVDSFHQIVDSADLHDAERVWMVGTDHGHTFTRASRARPWRLTKEPVDSGHMHCCLATAQEARTFVALVGEPGASRGVDGTPVSTLAIWSEIERRFGVKLDLPDTSAFALPGGRPAFDDGIFVSVGNSGSLFGRYGDFSYHSYEPAKNLSPAWELGGNKSRLLFGSPEPAQGILAEELYDVANDPREKTNLAGERFDDLLDMRRRMTDWLAEYGDRPEGDRYEYRIELARPMDLSVSAPRPFFLQVDGQPMTLRPARSTASAAAIRLRDAARPLGVVDLGGEALRGGLVVRCKESGLPIARLDRDHPRLNLAVARTNCPSLAPARDVAPPVEGEAWFHADGVGRNGPSAAPVAVPELRRALVRWGYVRDK